MNVLLAVAAYGSAEFATRHLESTGAVSQAEFLDLIKPSWTWGLSLYALRCYSPVGAHLLGGFQLLAAVVTGTKGTLVHKRYITYPAVGTVAALLIGSLASASVSGTVTATLVFLHVLSCIHEAVWRMTFPAPLIGHFTPLDLLHAKHATKAELISVKSSAAPNVKLSGAILRGPEQAGRPPRWIFYLGGNGELWENSLYGVSNLARRLGANAVLVNYRGVGKSGGVTRRSEGMVADASDVIQYLLDRDPTLRPSDITLFGHSIGGGVAAGVVRSRFPDCSIVLDRTFSSLGDAARGLFPQIPKPLANGVMSAVFGLFDSEAAWDNITHNRKLVTYHREDRIITFKGASLARLPKFQTGAASKYVVELTGPSLDPHNVDINELQGAEEAFRRITAFYRP